MGRRALRKLDPSVDVARHLRALDALPRPLEAAALFGRGAPLEIEVGSGKGLFLVSAAAANPEHDFLGIELARKYAMHAAARLARRSLANACVVHGDALRVFAELLADDSAAAVHVYFPDPWWKARHKKRRVMNSRFLHDVERTLRHGGVLHFWTDVQEYFETTVELVRDTVALAGPIEVAERPAEHELDFRTHFERRMRLSNQPVYRAEFRKQTLRADGELDQ
jgi:tRNA (guanine-N7-)-methyltransferase